MERRNFVKTIAIGGAALAVTPLHALKFPTELRASAVKLGVPSVHVRHGLYNPAIASKLTNPIAGNWVYSFSNDVFARDGFEAQVGDKNPISVSMFVGTKEHKELIHFIVEDNHIKQLMNNELTTQKFELNDEQPIACEGKYSASLWSCNSDLQELAIPDGEHFIALISGEARIDGSVLDHEHALLVEKSSLLSISVQEKANILVVSKLG